MAIRDLLVHLDQSDRSDVRLALAIRLAIKHNAKLIGLFAQNAGPTTVGLNAKWPSKDYVRQAELSRKKFTTASKGLKNSEWRDLNRGGDASIISGVTEYARCVDLVVVGQNSPDKNNCVPEELAEELVINSGTPVLAIPYAGDVNLNYKNAVVAWNNSKEAVHAIRDAVPILQEYEKVTVVSLDYQQGRNTNDSISTHLERHTVNVESEELQVRDIGVMDMLLNRVSDLGADLLVMGGNGHIGFPFFSQGAGTRYILKTMTVPVMMAS